MNVSLGEKWEAFIAQCVESGRYLSASEVVRDAMRLLEEQEVLRLRRLDEMRKEVQLGIDAMERGEFTELANEQELQKFFENIMAEGRSRLEPRKASNA